MISVIVPIYNEENAIKETLLALKNELSTFEDYEIIAVNDGSADSSYDVIKSLESEIEKLTVINHVENMGYGQSLHDGIVKAKFNCIAITDSDGSYPIDMIKELYKYYPDYDMVVGARTGKEYKRGIFKKPARTMFNFLVEYATGRKVPDVNSGLRIFKKDVVMQFSDAFCTGFSFTTTITLFFFLNMYYVKYIPINYLTREGKSKVNHFRDTLRAAQIIVQSILYYNPTKLFLLIAGFQLLFAILIALINFILFNSSPLYFLSAALMSTVVPIFCLGLTTDLLKQIYKQTKKVNQRNG